MPRPLAFMSYARTDDRPFNWLSRFREELSAEVQVHTGEEFKIFQDWEAIDWGQDWEECIRKALEEDVIFLIPILTPTFFKRDWCVKEASVFLEKEESLGRRDLVLPIYFVDYPLLNDPVKLQENELARKILKHQPRDWRPMRTKPFEEMVTTDLPALAISIRNALDRVNR